MNPLLIGSLVFVVIFGAAMLALLLGVVLPKHHMSGETKDTVKLAMGLVATMTALVLGLLIASAKGSFDNEKTAVTSIAARVAFLDHLLAVYGPDAAPARESLRQGTERMVAALWPQAASQAAQTDPHGVSGDAVYHAIQDLSPQTDPQREIKAHALAIGYEVGQMRWLLSAQSGSSISTPLLVIVVCWLAILFFSFGLFAPANGTAVIAMLVAALSIAGAIFLILELDHPFGGVIQIPSQIMTNVLAHLGS